jgi:hypothetical protein
MPIFMALPLASLWLRVTLAWPGLTGGSRAGLSIALLLAFGVSASAGSLLESDRAAGPRWYRGATHVHTLWSDGDAAPEMVAAWYRDHGFNFVALSDHDALAQGEWWFAVGGGSPLSDAAVRAIADRFGETWLDLQAIDDGGRAMRLKTHAELAAELDVAGSFLMLSASEITTSGGNPHVVALNLQEAILGVASQTNQARVLGSYLEALRTQAEQLDVPMLGMVNHLNWGDGLPARRLLDTPHLRLFEVYNGSDERGAGWPEKSRPNVERIWDIVLSLRLQQDPAFRLYGVASDDAHQYADWGSEYANPGRGWVAVRAESLTAHALIASLQRGEFYSSTGVELADVRATGEALVIAIRAEPGVRYTTEFIGTLRGFDAGSQPALGADGEPLPGATRHFSPEIGRVLHTTRENPAVYRFHGDELYVRARVRADVAQENPIHEGDLQTAWTQPVGPGREANADEVVADVEPAEVHWAPQAPPAAPAAAATTAIE